MNILMPRIASRLFGEPLLVDAGKLAAILMGIGGRVVEGGIEMPGGVEAVDHWAFAGGRPSDALGRVGDPLGSRYEQAGVGNRLLSRFGNVGVIAIEGTLVHKGKFVGQSSGETSYEGLQAQVLRAQRDPEIKGVVFEVDSFGGEAAGGFETSRMMAELSRQKPTLAILTDFALSAGYLLASAARQIVMPETGAAGSIGVMTVHADISKQLADRGIKVTLISSGAHKVDGHSAAPLPDEVRARIQSRVDATRDLFAEVVAENRGARLTKAQALATEARVYHGQEAVSAGLVDGIVDSQIAFKAFVKQLN